MRIRGAWELVPRVPANYSRRPRRPRIAFALHGSGEIIRLQKLTSKATVAILAVTAVGAHYASALSTHNVASGLQRAVDQGPVAADTEQTLTLNLKLHNQAGFDAAVKDLYDPESANFHKWFTDADFAKYAPTAADVKTVQQELSKQGLSVVSVDPQNFSIRVHGNTSTVEKAFQTELHSFNYNGTTFQAHIREAQLPGAAGELVDSVVGLDRHQVQPRLTVAKNPLTNQQLFKKKVTASDIGSTLLGEITGTPLTAPALATYTTPGASLPLAVGRPSAAQARRRSRSQLRLEHSRGAAGDGWPRL